MMIHPAFFVEINPTNQRDEVLLGIGDIDMFSQTEKGGSQEWMKN